MQTLSLEPSGGGCFEIQVDGNLVYSKLETGEFPDENAVLQQITAAAKA